ncbi:putative hydrolase of the HAD superfamily [Jatrophihabitans sp. GAS493]|uniref:HAD family hydrolase n=1 Tax=Jatrophihabitans sp. GAS493 TaxID=1907575 RepID=UPI000BB6E1F4|nr:HAD family phosphatase [Jatrophihabitans sp. GAS493]SOD73220.1 putative hydrolase of the HAD superfamily [Jatrophihabitans sp. GAS493]
MTDLTPLARPSAVIFDFGGVLTTSVLDAFGDFGERICGDRGLPMRLFRTDEVTKRLLAAHEEGRLDQQGFEEGFAARLREHGAEIGANGLLRDLQSGCRRDDASIELLAQLRAAGVSVGLISNSLGDCYDGYDLDAMFDAVTISGQEGVRKPSRRLYQIGCERLGVPPGEVVMIDDLEHNIVAAERLGMTGIVHRSARETARALQSILGITLAAAQ